jgi:hypothetical protein
VIDGRRLPRLRASHGIGGLTVETNRDGKPWLFASYAAIGALLLACATPPFQIPDETNHLLRADQIARGQLLGWRVDAMGGGGEVAPEIRQLSSMIYQGLRAHGEAKTQIADAQAAGALSAADWRIALAPPKEAEPQAQDVQQPAPVGEQHPAAEQDEGDQREPYRSLRADAVVDRPGGWWRTPPRRRASTSPAGAIVPPNGLAFPRQPHAASGPRL